MIIILLVLILIVLISFMILFIKDKFPLLYKNIIFFIKKSIYVLKNEFKNTFKSITTKVGIGTILLVIIYSYSKYRFFDYKNLIKVNENMRTSYSGIYYDYTLNQKTVENLYFKKYGIDLKYILLGLFILILLQIIIKKTRTIPLLSIFLILILGFNLYLNNGFDLYRIMLKENFDWDIYYKNMKIIGFFYLFIPLIIGNLLSIKYLKKNRANIFFICLSILVLIFEFFTFFILTKLN